MFLFQAFTCISSVFANTCDYEQKHRIEIKEYAQGNVMEHALANTRCHGFHALFVFLCHKEQAFERS